MYYVYLLQSKKDKSFYVGCTSDLRRRFMEHNLGKSLSTKSKIPFVLIYYEAFRNKKDAFKRERTLKYFGQGIRRLKERLSDSIIK